MSTTIDNRVLEMRFDNKQFENGVATSMSTLDKLKQKLNLSGASKGLENLGKSAKNVNFSGLSSGIEAVSAKFSAMQVVGITALTNITNSAINTGKRMVKALTLDPVTTGFNEYETKMNSIQTIMSNTASKGTTMSDVTRVIDELNTYADKTIYNFAEMTRNIGTFTAAGVGLEESASAIKGIANLAAASGSSSQQASTAMYQLSQALAAGTVKLMDWNSVVNAGMGGEKFQNALKETAREMGIAVDDIITKAGSFRESLKDGWMTADVLNTTLNKFTVDGAKNYSEAMVRAGKYTQEQADALLKEAQAMEDAATKVKTFTQLWDTMKEAAQSGWGKTWELIVGDFEKAKERLSSLSDIFGGFIDKMSDSRNNFLESGLSSSYDIIIRKLNTVGIETDKFQDKIKKLSKVSDKEWAKMVKDCGSFEKALADLVKTGKIDKSTISDAIKSLIGDITGATESTEQMAAKMEDYGEIVNKVIMGDFGNGEERIRALTEAGYDYATIQNLVNEKLGSSVRHESEATKAQEARAKSLATLTESQKKNADSLAKLTNAQLESKGYTEEQIQALRFLANEADQAGRSISDLVNDIDKVSGAELIWDSLMNIIDAIGEKFKIIGEAWHEIFGEADSNVLRTIVEDLHVFTENLTMSEDQAKNFRTTMEGVFAGLDITSKIVWKSFSTGLKLLDSVLKLFGTDLFGAAAAVADYIIKLREWLNEHTLLIGSIDKVGKVIYTLIEGIHDCVAAFMDLLPVKEFIDSIGDAIANLFGSLTGGFDGVGIDAFITKLEDGFANIESWIKSLANSEHLGRDIVRGLINGIQAGIGAAVDAIIAIGTAIIEAFCALMGIHSPSTLFFYYGQMLFQGLIDGIVAMVNGVIKAISFIGKTITDAWEKIEWDKLPDALKKAFNKLMDFLKGFDFKKLLALIPISAAILMVKKIYDIADILADGIKSINSVLGGVGSVIGGLANIENAFAKSIKAKALRNIALSIGILVAAVIALTFVDPSKLAGAVSTIVILSGVMIALAFAMKQMDKAATDIEKDGSKLSGLRSGLVAICASLLMLALAVKLVGSMNPEQAVQGFLGVAAMVIAIGSIFAAYGLLVKGKSAQNIDKAGKMIRKLATSLLLMALLCKLVGMLTPGEMIKGIAFMTAFGIFVSAMMKITGNSTRHIEKVGKMIRNLSVSMILMVGVCKLAGMLTAEDMVKGVSFAAAFVVFVGLLVEVSQIGKGNQIAKLGGLLFSISVSMLLMVGLCKLVGMLKPDEMIKGGVFVAAFAVLVKALVAITTIGDKQQIAKVGATILSFSIAIGLLAGVCVLLSMLTLEGLAKGIAAVTMLGLVMAAMVDATKGATDVKGSLIVMVVAIGIMAGAVAALSMIDTSKLAGATAALGTLMAVFALMIKSLKGLEKIKMGPIIVLTLVVGALAVLIKMLDGIKPESAVGSAIAISTVLLAMSVVLDILSTINMKVKDAFKGAILLASLFIPLAAFVGILMMLQGVETAASNVLALIGLTTAMTLLLIPLNIIGNSAGDAVMGVLALTAMAAPLFAFVLVLKSMEGVERAMSNVQALTLLAGALTLMLIPLTAVGFFAEFAAAGIIALAAMAAPLYAFVVILKQMEDLDKAMSNALVISILMEAMSDALVKISLVAPLALIAVGAINSLIGTIGAIGLLATGIGKLMDICPGLEKFLDKGLSILNRLASGIGEMIGNFIGGIGEGLSDSLVDIGQDIADFMDKLATASTNASTIKGESFDGVKDLIMVMGDIAKMTVGTTLSDIFSFGGTSMDKFETDSIAFFDAMKSIAQGCTGFTFNETGFEILIQVAKELVKLKESIGPIDGIASMFTGSNRGLEYFADDAAEFIGAMKSVAGNCTGFVFNASGFDAIMTVATRLSEFQKTIGDIGGIVSVFTGSNVTLDRFSDDAAEFIGAMKSVAGNCTGFSFNEAGFNMIIEIATRLSEFQKTIGDIGGIASIFTGSNVSLEKFSSDAAEFIGAMKSVAGNCGAFAFDAEGFENMMTVATRLSEFQTKLEPMGGVISWFTGRDDLGKFGENIKEFGIGIGKLKEGMGEDGISEAVVTSVTNAGNALIALNEALPEESWFDGKMDLGDFSKYVSDFATAISDFSSKVVDIDDAGISSAISAAYRIKYLIESLAGLDTSGVSAFTGIGSGGPGADGSVSDIAKAIAAFGKHVAEIDAGLISSAITSANRLKSLILSLVGLDSSGVPLFKEAVGPIGKTIGTYSNNVSSVDIGAVISSIGAIRSLVGAISSMVGLDTSGVSLFKAAIDELATVQISAVISAFEGASSQLLTAGANLISSLIGGISSKSGDLLSIINSQVTTMTTGFTSKADSFMEAGATLMTKLSLGVMTQGATLPGTVSILVSAAAGGISQHYSTFLSAGLYLGSGLVIGIQSMQMAAYKAGYALGQAAAQGEKDGQDSHSPSKLTIKAGKWLGEGLVIGIKKMGNKVYKAGYNMGETATKSISGAISRVSDAINSDIDAAPTIRPVLDLSDVKTGARAIDGLFKDRTTIGISANANAASVAMSRQIQNGTADDIVGAINKLRKELGNVGGTTYQVNGITYDDGSNVTEAVKALVRAAKVERRI